MNDDERQIRELIEKWRSATLAGDLDTVLSLMADDAVFLTPGNPPMNKAGFADGFRGFAGRMRIDATQDIKEIRTSGDLAYCWSHLTVSMTNIQTGQNTRRTGHTLTVFRKSAGGTWILSRDANLLS